MPRAELWWRRARRGRHSGTARRGRRAVVGAAAQWRVGHIGERHALAGGTARDGQHGREVVRYSRGLCAARALSHMSQKTICACVSGVCAMMARATEVQNEITRMRERECICRLCSLSVTHTPQGVSAHSSLSTVEYSRVVPRVVGSKRGQSAHFALTRARGPRRGRALEVHRRDSAQKHGHHQWPCY